MKSSPIMKIATKVGKISTNTACLFFGYQPKVPTTLLKQNTKKIK